MEERRIPSRNDFVILASDKIRYCDTDRQGHVNNAVFSSFFETGRVEILYDKDTNITSGNCSFVIASIKLDFLGEIVWPGQVEIGTRISRIGRSSINMEQGLFQDGKCVALAETVIVQMNNNTRKSSALEAKAIGVLSKFMKA